MFRFDDNDLSCKPGASRVRAELRGLSLGWDIGARFARPNAMLDKRRPVHLVDSELSLVTEVAGCPARAVEPRFGMLLTA